MAPPAGPHRARVVFDDLHWEEDLARSTPEAAKAATRTRATLQRGVPIDQLRPCQDHARDGTRLSGCMKLYIPQPAGSWGLVFQLARDDRGLFLAVLAFGPRHPRGIRRKSVYQIAHERLQGAPPPGA